MSWLFGSKETKQQKQARKEKEKAAYLKAYEKAKIQSAAKRGRQAGSTSMGESVLRGFKSLDSGMSAGSQFAGNLFGSDFGLGPQPRRKTHHRKSRKGKTITIHVK